MERNNSQTEGFEGQNNDELPNNDHNSIQSDPRNEISFSRHYHPLLFKPSNSDEDRHLGFVAECRKRKASELALDADSIQADGRFICFPIPPTIPDSAVIHTSYKKDKPRRVAEFVRDLQVVTSSHIHKLMLFGALFPGSSITTDFPTISPKQNLLECLKGVVDVLSAAQAILMQTVDARSPCLLQSVPRMELHPSQAFGVVPDPRSSSNTLLSKLASLYWYMTNAELPHHMQVADYCLVNNESFLDSEPLYNDGKGLVLVRRQIATLDWRSPVHYGVVNAYARGCNYKWKQAGVRWKVSMDVVAKDERQVSISQVINHWITWMANSSIQLSKARMVTIPLFMDNHHCLLVVDFKSKMIELVDTVTRDDQSTWPMFARAIVTCFGNLLNRIDDPRKATYSSFELKVVKPTWAKSEYDPESGMSTMNLINLYGECKAPLDKLGLMREVDQLRSRMCTCVSIVTDKLNIHREELIDRVKNYVSDKGAKKLQQSEELKEWMALLSDSRRGTSIPYSLG